MLQREKKNKNIKVENLQIIINTCNITNSVTIIRNKI